MKKNNRRTQSPLFDPNADAAQMREALGKREPPARAHSAKQKLSNLWSDKRSLATRALLAALCAFTFAFTFIVFGPYELFIQSTQYLNFSFFDLVLPMALAGLAVFAVLFLVLLALRGKIYNCALSALFAVTVAGYLQGNFFNINHGSLDGSQIPWNAYTLPMIADLLGWLLIAAAVAALLYFSRRLWAHAIEFVCIIIIGAQTVALVSLLLTTSLDAPQEYYVSDRGIYDVADGNNVVVFLLDRFDNEYADGALELYPDLKEGLNDFTYYHNFTGSYSRTMPSVAYLLTGVKQDYTLPPDEYFKKAWSDSTFLTDIRGAGYQARVYSELAYVFGNAENLIGKIDNLGCGRNKVDYKLMLREMLNLSAYRYAPEACKPYFHLYTGDLAAITGTDENQEKIHVTDDPGFWADYRAQGLTVDKTSQGMFTFYHLQGAHDPYVMDENAQRVEGGKPYPQIVGNMRMIFSYLDELKAKGLYDKTTVIITADHGWTGTIPELDYQRMLALFIKPAGESTGQPMQISNKQICQDNLRASIISYFGLDTERYGRTIESIGEEEEMTRYFFMQGSDELCTKRDYQTVTYEIKGDANDFANWKIVKITLNKYPYYDTPATIGR